MKILVLQLRRIGDLVLTTPALAALRQRFPGARITLCVAETCAGLAPAMPGVDETVVLRRKGGNARLWMKLAFTHFDVCLDFTGNDRSAFFSVLSKAARRVAFRRVQKKVFRPLVYTDFADSSVRENHTVDHLLDLLRPLEIEARGTPVALRLPAENREHAARVLASLNLPPAGKVAVVHPGTARPEKYWLPERWAAVIDHCQETLGLSCLVTGSLDGTEQSHLAAIRKAVRTPFRDLSGQFDLLTLAALLERADLLLSMDSAPVHLAAAFGTPQIALFGETNPFHWRPRHENAVVLFAGNPGPLREFAPRFTRRPLSELSTQAVIDAIASLLRP